MITLPGGDKYPTDKSAASCQREIFEVINEEIYIMASDKDKDKGRHGDDRGSGSKRGFASMDEDKQREIASKGGKAAHEKGTAHEFDSEEAREAGRAAHEKGTAHEFDSEEAREAGRKGGKAAHEKGTAHEFDSKEAREAGRKGGESRGKGGSHGRDYSSSPGGGTSDQHSKDGGKSQKNK
jgi:general stress protein YciG